MIEWLMGINFNIEIFVSNNGSYLVQEVFLHQNIKIF